MTCEEACQLLHAYIDDELDIATVLQIENHLPGCPQCVKQLEAMRAVRQAVAQPALYYPASSELRDQISRAMRSGADPGEIRTTTRSQAPWWRTPMSLSSLAAALLLIIGSLAFLFPWHASTGEVDELVASHLRSLEASHLLDVESTDQHTVKPWFAGKVDFSPPVIDLSAEGFPLIGGRLDYLTEGKEAALVYRHQKHLINVFIRPGEASAEVDTKQGFNLIRFECKGMICWSVSDLNAAELRQFVDLFEAQKAASTRS
jgi:anti-sigma factor RsiW